MSDAPPTGRRAAPLDGTRPSETAAVPPESNTDRDAGSAHGPSETLTRASMRQVAERAEVAISSVSRVLSGHPDVSRRMRDRVMTAVRALDYEPDFLAQSLRRGATLSVGFVISDIANPLMADIAAGAESGLRAAGYSMLLMDSESQPELDAAHVRFLLSRRVDGLILSLSSEGDLSTLATLRSAGHPVVVLDRELPLAIGASSVLSDHRLGMTAAINHLVSLGHRRIALIAGSLAIRPGHERVRAMQDAIAASGADAEAVIAAGPFSPDHGERATHELLDRAPAPTAIIAGGNMLLVGCLRALQDRGVRVGADVSLVTCDDVPLAALYSPPVSVISRDSVGIGREAASLLLRRLSGDTGPERSILPTSYIPRGSTTVPAA